MNTISLAWVSNSLFLSYLHEGILQDLSYFAVVVSKAHNRSLNLRSGTETEKQDTKETISQGTVR